MLKLIVYTERKYWLCIYYFDTGLVHYKILSRNIKMTVKLASAIIRSKILFNIIIQMILLCPLKLNWTNKKCRISSGFINTVLNLADLIIIWHHRQKSRRLRRCTEHRMYILTLTCRVPVNAWRHLLNQLRLINSNYAWILWSNLPLHYYSVWMFLIRSFHDWPPKNTHTHTHTEITYEQRCLFFSHCNL